MRFFLGAPAIPDELLDRRDNGKVVFLCGAGVSIPSGMPNFICLTKYVIEKLALPEDSEIRKAFQPWLDDPEKAGKPLDQIYNLLYRKYRKSWVRLFVTERLKVPSTGRDDGKCVGYEHGLIKRISTNINGSPQIVTTNFDTLFELGLEEQINFQVAPDLTNLVKGINYLHGRLTDGDPKTQSFVLSSSDFGLAYLSEGWATQYIKNLLNSYIVVLLGYQAEDPPVDYLFQGLTQDEKNKNKLFAFDKGQPDDIEAKWGEKGIKAIACSSYDILWKTMEAWAKRADNPKEWRASIISRAQNDPKILTPNERRQVVHVVSSDKGAKQFFNFEPPPHAEWICVLDDNVRKHAKLSTDYEIEDESRRYSGLNSNSIFQEKILSNDNLRIFLCKWIWKSINSPVMAWWVAKQNPLHPQILKFLENKLLTTVDLHKRARKIWNLILDYHRDRHYAKDEDDWYLLNVRISKEGWTPSVFQEFRRCSQPKLVIEGLTFERLKFSLCILREKDWDNVCPRDFGFKVKFLNFLRECEPEVPDDALLKVFKTLEYQLSYASMLLSSIEIYEFDTPTCYPGREMEGNEINYLFEKARNIHFIKKIFDKIVNEYQYRSLYHSFARNRALSWAWEERFYFPKLKLYALSKSDLFNGIEAVEAVLSIDQAVFWNKDVARELLFLIVDRWPEFSENNRKLLAERILSGPDQLSNETDEQYRLRSNKIVAQYCRYIQFKGCDLPEDINSRLAVVIPKIPNWSNEEGTKFIDRSCIFVSSTVNEEPDEILQLPAKEIIQKARAIKEQGNLNLPVKRPFKGLVQNNPRKALLALILESKVDCFPSEYWSDLISGLPEKYSSTRLERIFLHRLLLLPQDVIVNLLSQLGPWIEKNFDSIVRSDDTLGWSVYDHIAGSILANKSVSGEISNVEDLDCAPTRQSIQNYRPSRDNSLVFIIGALLKVLKTEKCSLIPEFIKTRLENFLDENNETFNQAVYAFMYYLNCLIEIDPEWTKDHLIPMMKIEHSMSEIAWNSFLERIEPYSLCLTQVIKPQLLQEIKPQLTKLFPWINGNAWKNSKSELTAATLLYNVYIEDLKSPNGLTQTQMREAIRAMSHETRNELICWLGEIFLEENNDDSKNVIGFINEVWPKEKKYRTSLLATAWIGLLSKTGDLFPDVYKAVNLHLAKVEMIYFPFHNFDDSIIASRFPGTTLDLFYSVIPTNPSDPLSIRRLSEILNAIIEAKPKLEGDPRYMQLSEIAI